MLKQLIPYVVIFALVMVYADSCQNSAHREAALLNNLRIAKDSVKHLRDSHGKLVSRVETMTLTIDDLGKQGAALGLDNQDLKRQVGNLSNLVTFYKGKLITKGEVKVQAKDTTVYTVDAKNDTVKSEQDKVFEYNNGYISLYQLYNPLTGWVTTKYSYQTNFKLTVYKKADHKLNPFSRKRLYADFILDDPNATLVQATSVLIEQPPKKFYERTWFHLLAGALGGIWLSSHF